jgi:carboxylesterase
MSNLIPGAEPFFFRGGPTGALLIHGFTSAPKEMRPLGEALADAGHTVLGLRLPQHGTQPSEMFRSHWRDWLAATLDGYYLLRDQCDSVFAMGLSMGGDIALWLGAQPGASAMAGVVAMSTPSLLFYNQMDWRVHLAPWMSYFFPFVPKRAGVPTDPEMSAAHISYPVYPTRAIPHFRAVVREADTTLPRLTLPVLFVHSRGDTGIPPENMPYLYERVGSAHKEMFWLERSDHIVTEEVEREQLFARITAFMQTHQTVERA